MRIILVAKAFFMTMVLVTSVAITLVSCGRPGGQQPLPTPTPPPPQGGPQFVINSPQDGTQIAGPSFFSVQPLNPSEVRSVRFEVNGRELKPDFPGEDMFKVFLLPSDFPAGDLTLEATVAGENGRVSARTLTVTNVPNPPSQVTVGANGAVLGTTEANGAVSTLNIPPGMAQGANVSFESRTQEEIKASTGVDYDALGVTFLGAQEISSDRPLEQALMVSSGGFGPAVQPEQAVVQYMIAPDGDGDGIGELTVVNTASVAPNGDVISDPVPQVQMGGATVSTSSGSRTLHTLQQEGFHGSPGTRLEIEASGFNQFSATSNKAVFRSSVSGLEVILPVGVIPDPDSDFSRQAIITYVPLLRPGPATVTFENLSSGSRVGPLELMIEAPAPLTRPATAVIEEALAAAESSIHAQADRAEDEAILQRILSEIWRMQELFAATADDLTPEEAAQLDLIARLIETSDLVATLRRLESDASLAVQQSTPQGKIFTGTLQIGVAILAGAAAAVFAATPEPTLVTKGLAAGFGTVAVGLAFEGIKNITEGIGMYGDGPGGGGGGPGGGGGAACTPTSGGGGGGNSGMGSAPPPGGNGCGDVAGGGGPSPSSLRTLKTGPFSLEPGRYVIRTFVRGSPLAFSGRTDAGGYFFIPLIPQDEPFTAVAIDTLTGQTRTFEGVGPKTGESVYMFFDFLTTDIALPVADAGPNQSVTVGDTVQLDGSGSSHPNDDPLTYAWTFEARPTGSTATIDNANSVTVTFVADAAGEYRVRLTVSDGVNEASDTTLISATEAGENRPPVADAGGNQTVTKGDTVELDGSGSTDPDGDPLSYSWSLEARPTGSDATLSNPIAVATSFVADAVGEYRVSLTVSDGELSNTDTVTITAQQDTGGLPQLGLNTNHDDTLDGVKLYALNGAAGTRVNVGLLGQTLSGPAFVRVFDPEGTRVTQSGSSQSYAETGIFMLEQTGVYIVEVNSTSNATGVYTLGVAEIELPTPIALTSPSVSVSGEITVVGDHPFYSFSGAAGEVRNVVLSHTSGSLTAFLRLRQDTATEFYNGQVRRQTSTNNTQRTGETTPYYLSEDDTYLVEIDPSLNHGLDSFTGPYTLTIFAPEVMSIALDSNTEGEFDAYDFDLFSFNAEAGEVVNVAFASTGFSGTNSATIRLFDPSGQQVAQGSGSTYAETTPVRLGVSGAYLIVVDGNATAAGSYTLGLARIEVPSPLTLSSSSINVGGEITVIGDKHFYSFEGSADAAHNFVLNHAAGTLTARLYLRQDTGSEFFNGQVRRNAATTNAQRTVETRRYELPASDGYLIEIDAGLNHGVNSFTGVYDITVFSPETTAITFDSNTAEVLVPYGFNQLSFNALENQLINVALVSEDSFGGNGTVDMTVYDPSGRIVTSRAGRHYLETDIIRLTFRGGGTFLIVVDGRGASAGDYTLGLSLVELPTPVTLNAPPLNLGGELVIVGERAFYSFSGSAGDVHDFILNHASGSLNARLFLRRDTTSEFYSGQVLRSVVTNNNVRTAQTGNFTLPETDTYILELAPVFNDFFGLGSVLGVFDITVESP